MKVATLPFFTANLAVLVFINGTWALPQWLNNLRRDQAYAPAAYNPVYGRQDGHEGYTYGGSGPQPTVATTSSSSSSGSEASGMYSHGKMRFT